MLILVQELGSNVMWQENGVVTQKNETKMYYEKAIIVLQKLQEVFNYRWLSYNSFEYFQ